MTSSFVPFFSKDADWPDHLAENRFSGWICKNLQLKHRQSLQTCNLNDVVTAKTRLIKVRRLQFRVLVRLHLPQLLIGPRRVLPNSSDRHQRFLADLFSGKPDLAANRMTRGNWIRSDVCDAPFGCVCACVSITACLSLTWRNCWWTLCNPRVPSVLLRLGPRSSSRERQTSEKHSTVHASIALERDNYTNKKPAEVTTTPVQRAFSIQWCNLSLFVSNVSKVIYLSAKKAVGCIRFSYFEQYDPIVTIIDKERTEKKIKEKVHFPTRHYRGHIHNRWQTST